MLPILFPLVSIFSYLHLNFAGAATNMQINVNKDQVKLKC